MQLALGRVGHGHLGRLLRTAGSLGPVRARIAHFRRLFAYPGTRGDGRMRRRSLLGHRVARVRAIALPARADEAYRAQVRAWREDRETRLKADGGLADPGRPVLAEGGAEPLRQRPRRGHRPAGGSAPPKAGVFELKDGQVTLALQPRGERPDRTARRSPARDPAPRHHRLARRARDGHPQPDRHRAGRAPRHPAEGPGTAPSARRSPASGGSTVRRGVSRARRGGSRTRSPSR